MNDAYICKRCGHQSTTKSNLLQHLRRKVPCPPTMENISVDNYIKELLHREYNDKTYDCQWCQKCFNTWQSKSRHLKTCKKRQESSVSNNTQVCSRDELEMLKKQNKLLMQQVACLQQTVNGTTSITNITNNVTNNQVVNININNIREFDCENMDAVPPDLIQNCFRTIAICDLIENLHCDPDYPENHNFRIVSFKKQLVEYFKNNQWRTITMPHGLNMMIEQACRIFKKFHRNNRDSILEDVGGEEEEQRLLDRLNILERLEEKEVKPIRKDLVALLHTNKKLLLT